MNVKSVQDVSKQIDEEMKQKAAAEGEDAPVVPEEVGDSPPPSSQVDSQVKKDHSSHNRGYTKSQQNRFSMRQRSGGRSRR